LDTSLLLSGLARLFLDGFCDDDSLRAGKWQIAHRAIFTLKDVETTPDRPQLPFDRRVAATNPTKLAQRNV